MPRRPENEFRKYHLSQGSSSSSDSGFEWYDDEDEEEAISVEPMKRKRKADDDLRSTPQVESSIGQLDGRVTFFTGKGDLVVIKLDKEHPEVVVASEEVKISAGSRVLVLNAAEGYTGIALACVNPDSHFFLYDPHLGNAALIQRNIEANVQVCRNAKIIDETELDSLHASQLVDVIIFHPGGYTGMALIEDRMNFGAHVLKDGGIFYLISHKKTGAGRHQKMLQTILGDGVEVVGRGSGGFRVIRGTKTQASTFETRSIQQEVTYEVLNKTITVNTEPSLFSKEGLDTGTRFLLETVGRDQLLNFSRLLDVGCGWGAIGLTAATVNETGEVVMTDIDTRAVRLAQENAHKLNVQDRVTAVVTSDIKEIPGNFDLVLSNPPFHVDTPELIQLFNGMRDKLSKKGQLFFVVEKTYLKKLQDIARQIFGNITVVAEDPNNKFYVLSVKK